jgi:hypothetical protein
MSKCPHCGGSVECTGCVKLKFGNLRIAYPANEEGEAEWQRIRAAFPTCRGRTLVLLAAIEEKERSRILQI